jgi:hypothetical protein
MSFPFSMRQLRFLSSLGLLLSVLVIGILVFYRRRFMQAASARATLPRRAHPLNAHLFTVCLL